MKPPHLFCWCVAGAALCLALAARAQPSEVKLDEEIVFFSSLGRPVEQGKAWEIQVHGCIYEPEKRRLAVGLLRTALKLDGVKLSAAQRALFAERARLFMVDHERGRTIVVRVAGRDFRLPESRADGQFFGRLRLDASGIPEHAENLPIKAVLRAGDTRQFDGRVELWRTNGITVISDIDDTIKITNVGDHSAMLRNTFLEPFQVVPQMAGAYRAWAARSSAQFCYVSASPWQLFLPLSEFLSSNGFPVGAFCLRNFRWKDESFFHLFQDPGKFKLAVLEPLLQNCPERRFVLVGDSGEKDAETYIELSRKFPRQISRICIRDVTGETIEAKRYRSLLKGQPPELLVVFKDPAELAGALDALETRKVSGPFESNLH